MIGLLHILGRSACAQPPAALPHLSTLSSGILPSCGQTGGSGPAEVAESERSSSESWSGFGSDRPCDLKSFKKQKESCQCHPPWSTSLVSIRRSLSAVRGRSAFSGPFVRSASPSSRWSSWCSHPGSVPQGPTTRGLAGPHPVAPWDCLRCAWSRTGRSQTVEGVCPVCPLCHPSSQWRCWWECLCGPCGPASCVSVSSGSAAPPLSTRSVPGCSSLQVSVWRWLVFCFQTRGRVQR